MISSLELVVKALCSEYYKKQSKDLGIDDRVVWLGSVNRSKVPNLFFVIVMFMLCHHFMKLFGVVYAEAIASGKPIIASLWRP